MERKFVIITDSTSDMPSELREKYNVTYVPMNYVVDEVEYPASLDWETHSSKEFYDFMRNGKFVKTTQVPASTFEETFNSYVSQGTDVLYIACSSALSGSYNLACMIAKDIMENNKECKILCVDSRISSLGQAHQVIKASLMRDEGKTIDEIASYLEANRLKVNQFATVATFEYLKRSGRVKATKAFFGDLIGIKPIIISDVSGQNLPISKVKGMRGVISEIARLTVEAADDPASQTLYVSHADALETAQLVRDAILELAPFKEVVMSTIAPIVGASVGPGTVCAYVVGKEVTV